MMRLALARSGASLAYNHIKNILSAIPISTENSSSNLSSGNIANQDKASSSRAQSSKEGRKKYINRSGIIIQYIFKRLGSLQKLTGKHSSRINYSAKQMRIDLNKKFLISEMHDNTILQHFLRNYPRAISIASLAN